MYLSVTYRLADNSITIGYGLVYMKHNYLILTYISKDAWGKPVKGATFYIPWHMVLIVKEAEE